MNSFYAVEQMAKIRQQEICENLCNRPRLSKHNALSTLTQHVRQILNQRNSQYLQDTLAVQIKYKN